MAKEEPKSRAEGRYGKKEAAKPKEKEKEKLAEHETHHKGTMEKHATERAEMHKGHEKEARDLHGHGVRGGADVGRAIGAIAAPYVPCVHRSATQRGVLNRRSVYNA